MKGGKCVIKRNISSFEKRSRKEEKYEKMKIKKTVVDAGTSD